MVVSVSSRQRRKATLVAAEMLSPEVRWMQFEVDAGDDRFDHQAGQWVNVFLTENDEFLPARSYSLASAPGTLPPRQFDIAVGLVEDGRVSRLLHDMALGAGLEIDGPWGVFTLRQAEVEQPSLFIATGTGLVPLRAMLQQLPLRGAPIALLFGCRTQADLLWHEELLRRQRDSEAFGYHLTLSRPDAAWQGWRGYVQEHLPAVLADLSNPLVYICGRSAMIEAVRQRLKDEFHIDRRSIRTERFD